MSKKTRPKSALANPATLQPVDGDDTTVESRTFPKRDQFAAELIYFSDCILADKEPEPSGWEGLADVRIVRAIYDSTRTGKAVELPEIASRGRPTEQQEIRRPAHGKPEIVKAKSPTRDVA